MRTASGRLGSCFPISVALIVWQEPYDCRTVLLTQESLEHSDQVQTKLLMIGIMHVEEVAVDPHRGNL